ncbi:MAG: hypothetical protein ACFFA8_04820 [Promethearchaeota archaeon]
MIKRKILVISLLLIFTTIGIISQTPFSFSQLNEDSLTETSVYQLIEYANQSHEDSDINALNITLPSSDWNITGMDLNFTDIKLGQEIKSIEEGGTSFKVINKGSKGYGVQLNITDDILLFGVYIYLYLNIPLSSDVYVQINGYNQITHAPNNTIYGEPVLLNVTVDDLGWYIQNFPTPISLTTGQYYLLINGSEYKTNDNSDLSWYLNEDDSPHTSLYIAKYDTPNWIEDGPGIPFRHKLIQRTDLTYKPEDINMTLSINNQVYNVSNGINPGTGNLTIEDLNLFPNSTNLYVPVLHNQSVQVAFNVSYLINMKNILNSEGSVFIKANQNPIWSIKPTISRCECNYSVQFYYPQNWFDLKVLKDEIDITSEIQENLIDKYIIILNDSIDNGADWEITANSLNTEIILNIPSTQYRVGQELQFSLSDSPLPGTYTFQLINPYGFEKYNISKTLPSIDNTFSYTIPNNAIEGDYIVYIYFFNGTHAGVETQVFKIIVPFTINPLTLILIFVAISSTLAVTSTSYTLIKKAKKKRELYRKAIYDQCNDLLNIQYIIVSDKKSALNIYEQSFIGKVLDTTLISGFLEAIRTFGIELTDSDDQTQTIKLEYKKSKILMAEFKHFRIILIMNDTPSHMFLDSIRALAIDIGEKYDKYLANFKGDVRPFNDMELLIKKNLKTSFLYPLKIIKTGATKINPIEKEIIQKAEQLIKSDGSKYFYVSKLFKQNKFDSKEIETIFSLIDKNIFEPAF